jgi:hypothetical protein
MLAQGTDTPIRDTVGRTAFAPEMPRIPQRQSTAPSSASLDPYLVSMLGGLADTASTHAFLKRGTATEDNALVSGLAKHPNVMTAVGAATNIALPLLLKKTLGKKWPKIAEALAANQGALQMGYGALNTQNTLTPRSTQPTSMTNRKTSDMFSQALMSNFGDK